MPLNTESSVRSPTKRWSSILSQPSIFRKSSADHIHRYSTIESAGPTSPDVKRLFRTRRSVSAGDAVFDDPWEMRSASCCEFDRLRNNLGLDDADSLDNIFQRFFEINFTTDSLDERDTSSDSETLSSSEPHSSDSDLFLAAEAGQAPAAAIHSVDLASRVLPSPSIISSIPRRSPHGLAAGQQRIECLRLSHLLRSILAWSNPNLTTLVMAATLLLIPRTGLIRRHWILANRCCPIYCRTTVAVSNTMDRA